MTAAEECKFRLFRIPESSIMRVLTGVLSLLTTLAFWQCTRPDGERVLYSTEDFVTENYLAYQDSLVHAWNMMISDDNDKLTSLHELLSEMRNAGEVGNAHLLLKFEERLSQLHRIRYTQKSMSNADVIEEYDFASTSLVREILALAESCPAYPTHTRIQQLVEEIRLAEERIENYRADYDDLVTHYNLFLEVNKKHLGQVNRDSLRKKPLFQLVTASR